MENNTLSNLETRCRNLHSELSALLFWEWDGRFNIPLTEITKEQASKVQAIFSKNFESSWDYKTIKKAPKPVKEIANALSGIREEQILFSTNPDSDMILFATWWPWGNGETKSV